MATHSSILAWRIPWTEEPGGLLGRGSALPRLGAELELRRSGSWLGPLLVFDPITRLLNSLGISRAVGVSFAVTGDPGWVELVQTH